MVLRAIQWGALLAAVTVNPVLLEPIQAMYEKWTERIKGDSPDFERASLVCMAMDGLCFERMLGLNMIADAEWAERLKQTALALLK